MVVDPTVEVGLRHDVDDEVHVGVLQPAELRTLAPERADVVGGEPQHRRLARREIELAGQLGDPEAVHDVVGMQMNLGGTINR